MIAEVVQARLELHQKRVDHIDYLSSNYSEINWPGGGEKKYKKDFYERMVLKGVIKELKHILELNDDVIRS
jgi:hypothetical protein